MQLQDVENLIPKGESEALKPFAVCSMGQGATHSKNSQGKE